MEKIWKEHLEKVKSYKPGKPIEEVKRELGLDEVIKLASNENPLAPPENVIRAITAASKDINRYPDGGCFYLRKALSEKLGTPGENIVFGNGSDELILIALRAFLEAGDEVVVADPTFLIYRIASMVKGAKVKTVPLKDFKYDLEGMLKAITPKTKVVFIANPDNPTGSYVSEEELDSFIEKVPGSVLVFIDEAYYEFAKGEDYPETLKLATREDKHIIVARTFSKAYGLAGLRVGYGITRQDIAEVLNKVREPFNVNSIAQAAAVASLKSDEYMEESVNLVKKEQEKLYKKFREWDLFFVPSKTNFVLFNTKRDSSLVFESLLKKGVIVRDMSSWGIKGFLRVNIGLEKENDKFLEVLGEALKEVPEEK